MPDPEVLHIRCVLLISSTLKLKNYDSDLCNLSLRSEPSWLETPVRQEPSLLPTALTLLMNGQRLQTEGLSELMPKTAFKAAGL